MLKPLTVFVILITLSSTVQSFSLSSDIIHDFGSSNCSNGIFRIHNLMVPASVKKHSGLIEEVYHQ